MARDLTLKLRLALEDQGVAGKLSRAAASIVGLRREVVALGADSRRSLQALRDGMDSISRQLSGIERMARAAFLVFQGAGLAGGIARTAADFESLEAAMRAVFGSAEAAQRELEATRALSERLGVPMEALTRQWLGMAAAARGTALDVEQVREVFVSVAEAATVLGLSQDQLSGALLAVQQMISKGTVSSEELRQQLGERLYGAVQTAARAVGLTSDAFNDLLQRGMIPVDRFLPAFARQLREDFAGAAAGAANTARAAFARLENALLDLKLEFARSGFMDALVDAAKGLTSAFKDEGFRQSVREFGALIGNLTRLVIEHGDKLVLLGGVLLGARTGASIGRLLGPKGAVAGALAGGVAGGVAGASILPDGTASGQDERRVMNVEAAVARLKRRIEETKQAAKAGLIEADEAKRRIEEDRAQIERMLAKPAAPAGQPDAKLGPALQWQALVEQYRSDNEKLAAEIERARAIGKALGKPAAEIEAMVARIRAALAKKSGDTVAARLAAAKDAIEAELAILKDGLARAKAAYDAALEDRLISIRGYYAAKTAIEQAGIDADIRRQRELLAAQQSVARDPRATEADRIRAKAEVQRIEAELIVLNNRRADIERTNARAAAAAERELADALEDARLKLAQLTGTETDADRRAAIERTYRDLKARLAAEGQDTSLIDRLVDVEAASRNLAALEARWRLALETMRNAEISIDIQREQGLLTTAEAQDRIAEAHRAAAQALEDILPKMERLAAVLGPEVAARVAAFRNELAQVKDVADPVAASLNTTFRSAFEDMFTAIGSGAKTAKQAFLDFARSIISAINRIAAQRLAEEIFGAFGKGGGVGRFFASLFKGFSSGGYVTGPGTSTSDSIPARLSAGEYVVRAEAVRRFGVAFLDAINGLRMPPASSGWRLAFAAGGPVPAVQAQAPQQTVRIVNVIDPALAADYLNSAAGERTLLNLLSRNAGTVKQIIMGT